MNNIVFLICFNLQNSQLILSFYQSLSRSNAAAFTDFVSMETNKQSGLHAYFWVPIVREVIVKLLEHYRTPALRYTKTNFSVFPTHHSTEGLWKYIVLGANEGLFHMNFYSTSKAYS